MLLFLICLLTLVSYFSKATEKSTFEYNINPGDYFSLDYEELYPGASYISVTSLGVEIEEIEQFSHKKLFSIPLKSNNSGVIDFKQVNSTAYLFLDSDMDLTLMSFNNEGEWEMGKQLNIKNVIAETFRCFGMNKLSKIYNNSFLIDCARLEKNGTTDKDFFLLIDPALISAKLLPTSIILGNEEREVIIMGDYVIKYEKVSSNQKAYAISLKNSMKAIELSSKTIPLLQNHSPIVKILPIDIEGPYFILFATDKEFYLSVTEEDEMTLNLHLIDNKTKCMHFSSFDAFFIKETRQFLVFCKINQRSQRVDPYLISFYDDFNSLFFWPSKVNPEYFVSEESENMTFFKMNVYQDLLILDYKHTESNLILRKTFKRKEENQLVYYGKDSFNASFTETCGCTNYIVQGQGMHSNHLTKAKIYLFSAIF